MINHKTDLSVKGYTTIPSFIDGKFADRLKDSMAKSYDLCREIQIKNGIDAVTDGTIHHAIASKNEIYLDLIERLCKSDVFNFIKDYFCGNYIINSYGGVINLPFEQSYVTNMHRDIRFFSGGLPLMLNMLVMLDDLTPDNGALYLLAESHKTGDRPVEQDFFDRSDRAIGKKGDLLLFDSNLWHAAGVNKTEEKTMEVTITLTKPFMKQQLDYSRAIGYDLVENMNPQLQQLIGYFARTPSNLEEWYQKPENRFYRPGQD
jgi:ectoine hydroxylase-related dioxygenase (phytanoyl-CoA dioxygenase family)